MADHEELPQGRVPERPWDLEHRDEPKVMRAGSHQIGTPTPYRMHLFGAPQLVGHERGVLARAKHDHVALRPATEKLNQDRLQILGHLIRVGSHRE